MSTETTSTREQQATAQAPGRTVRDATFDVFRRRGLTRIFANPGSTEVPFLTDLPADFDFVLALHEGSVVGLATGFALGRGAPSLALLHTTAGLGNGVSAIATARVNRAPVVVLVGQQDRRHLAYEPFLAGRLAGLAGDYPVRVEQPVRAQDVPAAVERAFHAATIARGPALVIVPMDDWEAQADEEREPASAIGEVIRAGAAAPEAIDALAAFLDGARSLAIVVGAGADDAASRAALVALAERLGAPVYQEAFGARAGFPHGHRLFAGLLPAGRPGLRERLASYDTLLVVGGPAFRQSFYASGRFTVPGTRIALVTEDPEEAYRSPVELAVLASPASVCAALVSRVAERDATPSEPFRPPPAPAAPRGDEPLRASHVLAALADRLPPEAIVLEEAPVDRPELQERMLASEPFGYLSAAMGGLGFAVPGATGLRMALPERPIVAVVGDGSTIYGIQGLWSAAHYRVGVVFVVLSNGGYAIMDRLAENHGGRAPWPSFGEVELATVARGFGCPARRITTYDELTMALDEVVPTLVGRTEPLLLDVAIAPTEAFGP